MENNGQPSAAAYFGYKNEMSRLTASLSPHTYDGDIGRIIKLIDRGQSGEAICELSDLKRRISRLLDGAFSLIRHTLASEHDKSMEMMAMRREMIEHAKAFALVTDNDEVAAKLDEHLAAMDGFFAAAIADLDPER